MTEAEREAEREAVLQQALDGELEPCRLPADLREELAATVQLVGALRALPEAEPPAGFHAQVVRRLRLVAATAGTGAAGGAGAVGEAGAADETGAAGGAGAAGKGAAAADAGAGGGAGSSPASAPASVVPIPRLGTRSRQGAVLPWRARGRHVLVWAGGAVAAVLVLAVVGVLATRRPQAQGGATVARVGRASFALPSAHAGAALTKGASAAAPNVAAVGAAAGSASAASTATFAAQAAPVPSSTLSASLDISQRKIIKTAAITVRVTDVGAAFDRVGTLTAAARGYVAASSLYHAGGVLHATVSARVPSADLAAFTQKVGALGTVTAQSQNSNDVTQRYIDTEGRLQALEAERTAYLGLLRKTTSVADLLKVQQAVSGVEAQIESLTTEIQSLSNLSSLATVNVTLDPLAAGPAVAGAGGPLGGRLGAALANSWRALGALVAGVAVAAVWALPWLVLLAAIAAAVLLLVRRRRGPGASGPGQPAA